jgi:hypothetical protein
MVTFGSDNGTTISSPQDPATCCHQSNERKPNQRKRSRSDCRQHDGGQGRIHEIDGEADRQLPKDCPQLLGTEGYRDLVGWHDPNLTRERGQAGTPLEMPVCSLGTTRWFGKMHDEIPRDFSPVRSCGLVLVGRLVDAALTLG